MLNLDGCNFTETTVRITDIFYNLTIYVILPYYLVLSPIFNLLLIVALIRCVRAKGGSALVYQLLLVCAKSLENTVCSVYYTGAYWWGGLGGYLAPWFSASYAMMFVYLRCLNTAQYVVGFFALFMAVSMAADRVIALRYPIRYLSMNHKAIRGVVLVSSVCVSFAISLDKYWSTVIVEIDRNGTVSYGYVPNREYNSAVWGRVSESIRTYVRLSLTIALIVLNILMIDRYRRRMRKIHAWSTADDVKLRARKGANKDVVILCVCQSILMCFGQIPVTTAQMLRQSSAYWTACYQLLAPEYQAAIMLSTAGEFYVLVAVNEKIRNNLPGYKKMSRVLSRLINGPDAVA